MVEVIFLQPKSCENLVRIARAFLKHSRLLDEIEQLDHIKETIWEITTSKYEVAGYVNVEDLVWKVLFYWCEQHFLFPYNHPTPGYFLNTSKE